LYFQTANTPHNTITTTTMTINAMKTMCIHFFKHHCFMQCNTLRIIQNALHATVMQVGFRVSALLMFMFAHVHTNSKPYVHTTFIP
jgi:hypothetical protein